MYYRYYYVVSRCAISCSTAWWNRSLYLFAERVRRQGEAETSSDASCPQVEVLRGRDGRDGRDGARGERGDTGSRGEKGELGEIGPQGSKGESGMPDAQGPVGEKGDRGIQGLPGPQGAAGISGPQGLAGPQGEVGEKGGSGEKGDRGMQGLPGPQGPSPLSGGLYTRWGRTSCPDMDGTETVYSGRIGGSDYGSNFVCMPDDPQYLSTSEGIYSMYGVEYYNHPTGSNVDYHNAPCAVCYTSTRGTILMLPAKFTCPSNWTTEYSGYLMTDNDEFHSHHECVDSNPETIPGYDGNQDPNIFYTIKVNCDSNYYGLSCPPYTNKALPCVVCSR